MNNPNKEGVQRKNQELTMLVLVKPNHQDLCLSTNLLIIQC